MFNFEAQVWDGFPIGFSVSVVGCNLEAFLNQQTTSFLATLVSSTPKPLLVAVNFTAKMTV